MAENVIAAGSKNRPSMLEKGMYDSWKTLIILYIRGKENGEKLKDLIDNGPYQLKPYITVKDIDGVTDNLDIYTLINHYQTAKEIWDRIKELIEGTEMTKQEHNEFNKFISDLGESIHSYYLRYAKLINDMKMIPMSMSNMKINIKFVNHLQPEWSRQSQGYTGNARNKQALGARVVNTLGNAWTNQPGVKDSELFKEKMLLDQAQEVGVVLNDEQQNLLADSLEKTNNFEDL
nr:hypothetical protein [Tanacetum cinerariifolium]